MQPENAEKYICLDSEFVEGDEIIELSIYSYDRRQLYHERFKPRRYRTWDSSIHHITPEMVADSPYFSDCKTAIQEIVDRATHLIGFAVDNDTSHLTSQGIHGLKEKRILELRNWFWINYGKANGLDLFQKISLDRISQELGVSFGDEGMHSASGDTLATLDAQRQMLDRFVEERGLSDASMEEIVEEFDRVYEAEKFEYDKEHSHGYALLLRFRDGYDIRCKSERPEPKAKLVATVEVEDRNRALVELQSMFANRRKDGRGPYYLTKSDIERFKGYSNGFDTEDHQLYSKLRALSGRFQVGALKRK